MDGATVNPQVTDAVTQAATLTIGSAPPAGSALAELAMAQSLSVLMTNAVAAQQRGSVIGLAATSVTCTVILAAAIKELK